MIKGCKNFDRKAQKELYLMYADDLMSIAIRYSNDTCQAKDLIQDTFIKVFRSIPSFKEGKGSLIGWMTRILINEALQKYRKEKRMVEISEVSLLKEASDDFSIIQTLEAEDILNLLQELPEGCRVIFNLYVIEGYKHQEIGELLNISASASRSQLTRAKQLLRDKLTDKKKVKPLNQKKWKSISKIN